jgi:methyl-CpG-binding domain protein 2
MKVFWEKRLERLKACDEDGEELESLELPRGVEAVGPHLAPDTVLQSVATALHLNGQPITGQTGNRLNLETNPGVYLNPEQPLIQVTELTHQTKGEHCIYDT